MERTVRNVLARKGQRVWSVGPQATVLDAISTMAEKGIGAVVVVRDRKLIGVFSERDYLRKVALEGRSARDTSVEEIMTGKVYCVTPEWTVDSCMALMTEEHVRHLPVLEDDELVGIVSIGDVVKAVIEARGQLIEQLERYIVGYA